MKKASKLIPLFVVLLLCCSIVFVACKNTDFSGGNPTVDKGINDGNLSQLEIKNNDIAIETGRKIIYNADVSLTVDDLKESQSALGQKLNDDEWVESTRISDRHASIVVRIKSTRLNAFLDSLSGLGVVKNSSIESYDVTENYYDNTIKKTTLETEQATLLTLLEKATTINDVLAITERLSAIEVELQNINGTLNRYDSLIDYSVVTIDMYTEQTYHEDTFWEKLAYGFGIVLDCAEGLLIFILCILPVGVVVGGIVIGVLMLVKKYKAKKRQKKLDLSQKNDDEKQD